MSFTIITAIISFTSVKALIPNTQEDNINNIISNILLAAIKSTYTADFLATHPLDTTLLFEHPQNRDQLLTILKTSMARAHFNFSKDFPESFGQLGPVEAVASRLHFLSEISNRVTDMLKYNTIKPTEINEQRNMLALFHEEVASFLTEATGALAFYREVLERVYEEVTGAWFVFKNNEAFVDLMSKAVKELEKSGNKSLVLLAEYLKKKTYVDVPLSRQWDDFSSTLVAKYIEGVLEDHREKTDAYLRTLGNLKRALEAEYIHLGESAVGIEGHEGYEHLEWTFHFTVMELVRIIGEVTETTALGGFNEGDGMLGAVEAVVSEVAINVSKIETYEDRINKIAWEAAKCKIDQFVDDVKRSDIFHKLEALWTLVPGSYLELVFEILSSHVNKIEDVIYGYLQKIINMVKNIRDDLILSYVLSD